MDQTNLNWQWLNEPKDWKNQNDKITIVTEPNTDYWSKTHYGFIRYDAPTYVTKVKGDFVFTCKVNFSSKVLYDQAGIILFEDKENWIKASSEYHDENYSTLGSVVTNLGYSDWGYQRVSSQIKELYYRLKRKGQDFNIEFSYDGKEFHEIRVCHLHKETQETSVGIYACSPQDSSFQAEFSDIKLELIQ
ncbi:unnamed protein product [Paramecium primaurelia]|uniref:DUF1349 domain-containing protein n=1 Tax=Paramecium primaurelia TaxID=5886 RepID=A0A8S1JSD2_PARPR|nr:unnamed protein product [Paramecium primaurelia]